MGIPKFFRFMSERYPMVSQLIEEGKIPVFDALYLDMNGVIHNCSHPNDGDASFRISESAIFLAIFAYIEHLFTKIKPQKLFFLAVDGVAPRAKMNQQRSRRFRTAKEAKELKEKAEKRGEELPEEEAFDSNCITPGTPFMTRLSQQLQYFIAKKLTEDAAWRGVEVVLSGHDVPGEGEHKIMEYIRLSKAQPDYDPNRRHCLYGLDADLIMLGLLSHDPHFCLLREEVTFGPQRKKAKASLESQNFFLLHLSLFREYLDLEFQDLKSVLPFEYNLERIIDDFILINIFIGNDFLPHLPSLHVNEGAISLLFGIYKRVLPVAGGYLNEGGNLRVDRLQLVLAELTKFEQEEFEKEFADVNWYKGKQEKHIKAMEQARAKGKLVLTKQQRALFDQVRSFVLAIRQDKAAPRELYLPATAPARDRRFLEDLSNNLRLSIAFDEYDAEADAPAIALSSDAPVSDDNDIDEEESLKAVDRVLGKYLKAKVEDVDEEYDVEDEYSRKIKERMDEWKRGYYKEKMNLNYDNEEEMAKLSYRYVEGLQWVLHYYYDGVASWGWFYNYHYAPKISDLKGVTDMVFNFELGKPFKPFEQLMAVLPSLSNSHIPSAFRDLMTDPNSPIIDFYPLNFEADLNGKKQDWEAVVKIPFIEENRLLNTLGKREPLLTSEERSRNGYGSSKRFTYDSGPEHFYPSSLPGVFPDIVHSRVCVQDFNLPTLDGLHLVKGLCDGVRLGAEALAGFPSIKTVPHYGQLGFHGVNVFQSESKRETMVINVENTYESTKPESVAQATIGKRTFIGWPFLIEGLVVAVSDSLFRYELGEVGGVEKVLSNPHRPEAASAVRRKAERIEHTYSKRFGVLIGNVEILLHVRPLKGLKRMDDGAFVKDYEDRADKEVQQALQLCVSDVVEEDERYIERPALALKEEFPEKSRVFFLGNHAYGTPAHVVGSADNALAIEIAFFPNQARENAALRNLVANRTREGYYPAFAVSKRCGLTGLALAKITSSLMVSWEDSKVNVGLNLKFEAKGQKVLGYSRKGAGGWEFSDKAVELITDYRTQFPEVVQKIAQRSNSDLTKASDFFEPSVVDTRMRALKGWIKERGVRDLETVPLFAEQLGRDTVQSIEGFTARLADTRSGINAGGAVKRVFIKGIPRTALLKPAHAPFRLQSQKFQLGDRVVMVQDTGNVPLSARGVVIGLNTSSIDVVFDVPFLSGTTLGDRCSAYRGATVGFASVLNLSQPQYVASTTPPNAAAPAAASPASALNRTLANGSTPLAPRGGGANRGRGGPGRGGANFRPPNMFQANPAAAAPRGGAPVQILQRPGGASHGRPPVNPDVPFAGVASGAQRPSQIAKAQAEGLNPHLAALNLNGGGAGAHHHAQLNGAHRGGPPPTAPRGPKAGINGNANAHHGPPVRGARGGGANRGRGRGRGAAHMNGSAPPQPQVPVPVQAQAQ